MKQVLLIINILASSLAFAQPIVNPLTVERRTVDLEKANSEAPKPLYMEWQSPVFNFGVIDRGQPVSGTFAFKNISEAPIFIQEAKGTCDCTGVEFPKEPILPGEIAEIVATYDASVVGPFKKTVTVRTNLDKEEESTVLYIKGEVIWQF